MLDSHPLYETNESVKQFFACTVNRHLASRQPPYTNHLHGAIPDSWCYLHLYTSHYCRLRGNNDLCLSPSCRLRPGRKTKTWCLLSQCPSPGMKRRLAVCQWLTSFVKVSKHLFLLYFENSCLVNRCVCPVDMSCLLPLACHDWRLCPTVPLLVYV